MEEEIELWKDIEGFDGFYQISNMGRVKSLEKILNPFISQAGYVRIYLKKGKSIKAFSVHRLVAIHFIPNPENKPTVNHKFKVKTDNRYHQLEWMTNRENIEHCWGKELTEHYANQKRKRDELKELKNKENKNQLLM